MGHPVDLLLPEVEFHLALAYDKAGMESNALAQFTNFVARFPSNSLAPWAQNWVADFYYNQEDFQSAEKNYQMLYQKFRGAGDLAWQARLLAGKAALANQEVDDAAPVFFQPGQRHQHPAGAWSTKGGSRWPTPSSSNFRPIQPTRLISTTPSPPSAT